MLAFPSLRPCLAALPMFLAAVTGCGVSYAPARTAGFELDAAKEIDDDDIRKAFEAKPQMSREIRIAYFTFDPEIAKDVDGALAKLPGVSSVYRIPPLMVSGQRRIEEHGWGAQRDVTIKKLRLFAARAHADVLIVLDHGFRTGGANGLAAFNALILPIFFLPFLDNTVEGYAEGYVIDVRNGYLYGHVTEEDKRGDGYVTIYGKGVKEYKEEQWAALRAGLVKDLSKVITDERARSATPPPGTKVAVPVPNTTTPAPASGPVPAPGAVGVPPAGPAGDKR